MRSLDELRELLFFIDQKLLALYTERVAIVEQIKHAKADNTPVYCPEIESIKKQRLLNPPYSNTLERFVDFLLYEGTLSQKKEQANPFFRKSLNLEKMSTEEHTLLKKFLIDLGTHIIELE